MKYTLLFLTLVAGALAAPAEKAPEKRGLGLGLGYGGYAGYGGYGLGGWPTAGLYGGHGLGLYNHGLGAPLLDHGVVAPAVVGHGLVGHGLVGHGLVGHGGLYGHGLYGGLGSPWLGGLSHGALLH